MDDTTLKDYLVVFRRSHGDEGRGSLVHLSPHGVTFEFYGGEAVLRTSEVLSDFQIYSQEQLLYSGRAVVRQLTHAGSVLVCEAHLDEGGFTPGLLEQPSEVARVKERFREFLRDWQKFYPVSPAYKTAVADIQTFLLDLRRWVEQLELGIRSRPTSDRVRLENALLDQLQEEVVPVLDNLFRRFEEEANGLNGQTHLAHRSYVQRILHPLVLCAPFAHRTYHKPLGYAGDYEMVNMMARDPREGATLFAKLFNIWLIHQDSARAHRNRLEYLTGRLREEALRCRRRGEPLRVINVGCGPALEVQRFLTDPLAEGAEFLLLDFNDETVEYTTGRLSHLCRQHGRQARIEVRKKSVHHLLRETHRPTVPDADRGYEVVCCSGLFDYLSDRTCKQLMNIFWNWARPGGVIITTNVTPVSPNRGSLELILDWHLIYRDTARFASLAPDAAGPEQVRVFADATSVNVFLEARKPDA